MNVAGGGINIPYWLQIKADVSGIPNITEAALLGAAFVGLQDMLLKYDEWLHSHKNIIKSI
jgi:sugar (pentulose or hexulose) kinase